MYLLRHAFHNAIRNWKRNLLIVSLLTVIIILISIARMINATSIELANQSRDHYSTEVSFCVKDEEIMKANDEAVKKGVINSGGFVEGFKLNTPTLDEYKKYAQSQFVEKIQYNFMSFDYESNTLHALSEENLKAEHERLVKLAPNMVIPEVKILGSIYAYDSWDSVLNEKFTKGSSEIREGTEPVNLGDCVISIEFAELNQLHVGNEISLSGRSHVNGKEIKPFFHTLKVSGIYFDGDPADQRSPGSEALLTPYLNSRNDIYTNEETMLKLNPDAKNTVGASFMLKDLDDMEMFEQECYEKGLSPYYHVEKLDEYRYQETITPILKMIRISDTFILTVVGFGGMMIILLSMLAIRIRMREIGVLLSMGMTKLHITLMFIYETMVLTMLAVVIGFVLGREASYPITEILIQNQIQEQFTQEEASIQSVEISLSGTDYGIIILTAFLLGICASASSAYYTARYEPNEILRQQ